MKRIFSFLLFLFIASSNVFGDVSLPKLLSDGVIFQRNQPINVWGWADPGEAIQVNFKGKKYKTTASQDGHWKVVMKALKAGGPYEMTVKGNNEITVKDILIGDVWMCAGQSNMVLYMERLKEKYMDEILSTNNSEIRHFFIPTTSDVSGPQEDLTRGEWKSANPENIMRFSGVAYFFAKKIYEKHKVPIGLVNASVGGTPIEAWISEEGFKSFPDILKTIEKNKDEEYVAKMTQRRGGGQPEIKDKGLLASPKWFDPAYEPKGWRNINIPGYWEDQGLKDLNGAVWYRKEIEVPEEYIGEEVKLYMGRVVDADRVYVNGKDVGNITYQYPPRRYVIPNDLLKPGKNLIVIRVQNYGGKGGFVPDKPYFMTAKGIDFDLKGTWQYKVGEVYMPRGGGGGGGQFWKQNQPTSLYNAMVAPLIQHKVKGFLWYQGESNSGRPDSYEGYLRALIDDYRQKWGQGDLSFHYVQLANFLETEFQPVESNWATLRDGQRRVLDKPNTSMAVAIDLGEWNDIHPLNKKDVGERLALGALNLAYGEDIVYSGPLYKSHKVNEGNIILTFDHIGSGLMSIDGEPLERFEIAGPDLKFYFAKARISGNQVIVESEHVKYPMYVRYAWSNNPTGANLYNREGLPASPFQTFDPDELDNQPWQGRECAVVLTYDDALNVHLDNAIPLLDSLNLKGTFYLTAYSSGFSDRISDWRKAAQNGHEMGNHTLFHPCIGDRPGREWVNDVYKMNGYEMKRFKDELRMTNIVLETLDGKKERTFAYTCGDMDINGESVIPEIQPDFVAARAVRAEMHSIHEVDIYSMDSYMINGQSGEELIDLVKEARANNKLLIFLFHGVGGEHGLNVSLEAHRELLQYLKANENEVWTTTLIDVVENINRQQVK